MENFKDLNLSAPLAQAIEELGYTAPTPIQAQTLPLLLEGHTDFLGLAATGTGKTAAFGIPLLEQINNALPAVQAVVLCPTRELAMQVTQQLNLLGKYKKIRAVPIYGGAGYGDQMRALRNGAQIVVATPGRLIDHLDRGTITFDKVETIVLDEADEMISMGFKDDLEAILEMLPEGSYNTWLFSATMSKDIRKVADRFMHEPKIVQVNKSEMLSGTVRQIFYKVKESDKPDILCKLIDMEEGFYGLIFCQTKSLVADLSTLLQNRGYRVDCLHGDKTQDQRERTMRAFRERRVNILVCTDVASRGLDVKDLTHVVNYSIPRELDNYVHRIGRTGRSGKAGVALSLVTQSHMVLVGRIEKMTQSTMEQGTIPTRKDVGMKKVNKLLESFTTVQDHQRIEALLSHEWMTTLETMSKPEIAARLLALSFPETFIEGEKSQLPGSMGSTAKPVRTIEIMGNKIEVKPLEKPLAPGDKRGYQKYDDRPRAPRPARGPWARNDDMPRDNIETTGATPSVEPRARSTDRPHFRDRQAARKEREPDDRPLFGTQTREERPKRTDRRDERGGSSFGGNARRGKRW